MESHPIWRVRRLAIAARLLAGDTPADGDYRRAALEPFDAYVTPWGESSAQERQWPSTAAKPATRKPGPQF